MPSFIRNCLLASAVAWAAKAETIRVTATSSNVFSPDTVTAKQGDTIEFHFQAQNHSVVAGVFENPCTPMALGSGFFSGFMPVQGGGEAKQVFRVTVNSADPMPFFSSQDDECPHGMVGIINPNGDKTLDKYRNLAKTLSRAVSPSGSSYGGDLADDNQSSNQRNQDGTAKAAASAAAVPVLAMAVAGGVAVMAVLW
ncbi:hypothetical protein CP533_1527 [Ophiocordyceps camponoti-saundersi (nom. inval.)]|nr:hypothetical protein CP533_1527 [Ophiocordyceps camponoti-saundersi (nom. inval.)]